MRPFRRPALTPAQVRRHVHRPPAGADNPYRIAIDTRQVNPHVRIRAFVCRRSTHVKSNLPSRNTYTLPSPSPCPLDLVRRLLAAVWTQPVAHGLLLDAHALPVEPLILAVVVVACHHVAEADALAEAVLAVVRLVLFLVASHARHFLVLRARLASYTLVVVGRRRRCPGSALAALLMDPRLGRQRRFAERLL